MTRNILTKRDVVICIWKQVQLQLMAMKLNRLARKREGLRRKMRPLSYQYNIKFEDFEDTYGIQPRIKVN